MTQTNPSSFHLNIFRIRRLLLAQRTVRLILRAFWMGLAGYLMAWGLYKLFDVLSEPTWWVIIGVSFATPAIIANFRSIEMEKLVWKLDRLLGLRERVSTSWQVAQTQDTGLIATSLIQETAQLLPKQEKRILRRGWFLERDFESVLIMIVLYITVLWSSALTTTLSIPQSDFSIKFPPLGVDPNARDVFPSGIPGLAGGGSGAEQEIGPGGGADEGELNSNALGSLDSILNNLGEALSQQPETSQAGESLQQGDLEGAAQAIEGLADDVDLLPEDVRDNLQEALQNAGQQAQQANQEGLAEDLQSVADSLDNLDPNSTAPADALDDLADELRNLGQRMASMGAEPDSGEPETLEEGPQVGGEGGGTGAGSGAGSGQDASSEPLARLSGSGEEFELEGGEDLSGLLTPGNAEGEILPVEGTTIVQGGSLAEDTNIVNSILTPFHFSWKQRNVVSKYFSPPR